MFMLKRYYSTLFLFAVALTAGCEQALLHDPARAPSTLGMGFSLTGTAAMGGRAAAYDKADSVHVAIFRAADFVSIRQNFTSDLKPINAFNYTSASFAPGAENRVQVQLELENDAEPLVVVGALSRNRAPLFAGIATVVAIRGGNTSADVSLVAVPDSLAVTAITAQLAPGDSVRINAAVLFATGDTVTAFPLQYRSSNTNVATVDATGRLVARGAGDAQITVTAADQYFSLERTFTVTVRSVTAQITGQIINAVNRSALAATVIAYDGPTTVATATTNANGNYTLNLPRGRTYRLSAVAAGFITETSTLTADGTQYTVNFALSPVLPSGQTRIVLTWGANPVDLDAHLFGPNIHVFFGSVGSLAAFPFAQLDTDDTTGFGPETITIAQQQTGRYTFSVHHYAGTGTIATSGAIVRVFRGTQLVAEFAPPNQQGVAWNVFALDGQTITPIQTIGSTLAASTALPRDLADQLNAALKMPKQAGR